MGDNDGTAYDCPTNWQRQDKYCDPSYATTCDPAGSCPNMADCTQAQCCHEFNHCATKKDKANDGTAFTCPSNWQRQDQYCDPKYATTCDPAGNCPNMADCTQAQCCHEFNH